MKRRRLVAALAAGALPAAPAAAQIRTGPRRIGMLWPGSLAVQSNLSWRSGFFERLRALGWVEGGTIEVHERWAEGRFERLPELARGLVALQVELIVATAQVATEAARAATATIPIVMIHAGGIEGGMFQSLARPGGNVTGTTSMIPDLAGKQVELLHQLAPAARRVAMLANATNASVRVNIANALAAARALGLELMTFDVATGDEIASTLGRIGAARPDALLVAADPLTFQNRAEILRFAIESRLPAVYQLTQITRDGGLASYSTNLEAHYPRAAEYVDKILRGAKPADLPVEQPTLLELVVNLRTARAIGFEIPRAILDRADEVIE